MANMISRSAAQLPRAHVASEPGRTLPPAKLPFDSFSRSQEFRSPSPTFHLRTLSSFAGLRYPMKYFYASESKLSVFRLSPCPLYWCPRLAADPLSGDCSWFQDFANRDILWV